MDSTDPTSDLSDDDVRRVCDEADRETRSTITPNKVNDRHMVCAALSVTTGREWYQAARRAVARLRAERAERGTR